MKTILTVEKAVRKTVFTSVWKFFGVKDLTDVTFLTLGAIGGTAVIWMMAQGIINWL